MLATILKRTAVPVLAVGILAAGIAFCGQAPRENAAVGAQRNGAPAAVIVNDHAPDWKELLTTLLALEVQQYEAMSLRDENWEKRPAAFADLKELFAPDFGAITGWDDLLTRDQFFKIHGQIRLNDSKLSDAQLTRINEKAVILSYKLETKVADQHGGHQAKDRVASTWVQRGAGWIKVFEQSTRAGDPFPKP